MVDQPPAGEPTERHGDEVEAHELHVQEQIGVGDRRRPRGSAARRAGCRTARAPRTRGRSPRRTAPGWSTAIAAYAPVASDVTISVFTASISSRCASGSRSTRRIGAVGELRLEVDGHRGVVVADQLARRRGPTARAPRCARRRPGSVARYASLQEREPVDRVGSVPAALAERPAPAVAHRVDRRRRDHAVEPAQLQRDHRPLRPRAVVASSRGGTGPPRPGTAIDPSSVMRPSMG